MPYAFDYKYYIKQKYKIQFYFILICFSANRPNGNVMNAQSANTIYNEQTPTTAKWSHSSVAKFTDVWRLGPNHMQWVQTNGKMILFENEKWPKHNMKTEHNRQSSMCWQLNSINHLFSIQMCFVFDVCVNKCLDSFFLLHSSYAVLLELWDGYLKCYYFFFRQVETKTICHIKAEKKSKSKQMENFLEKCGDKKSIALGSEYPYFISICSEWFSRIIIIMDRTLNFVLSLALYWHSKFDV